ncbi:merozoite surface protein-3, putative [Perkinsus marinus ATCC 50983]|uniref:Merozoite surface protein-3, putative n=1 Tax=Perkinsus marinus (strain ATCC 50983 / TXsc) TaxID=423536 RepID=C5LSH4_PERM5|nr:merozoite surface protein-3, putative [Perkinsus marinus ATCC 50983]EER00215.1 merozoite surface protein-3, putative [Perkinsus marinus ATCC 50983]|eukprot:XP_002767497.1 merozoite surface protein-3, putative [Perkinsus marinus ATCC 50983]
MISSIGQIETTFKDERRAHVVEVDAVRGEAEKKLSEAWSVQRELRTELESANARLSLMVEESQSQRKQLELAQREREAAWEALKAKEKELAVAHEMRRKEAKLAEERYESLEERSQQELTAERDRGRVEGEAARVEEARLMKCIGDKEKTISEMWASIEQYRERVAAAKAEEAIRSAEEQRRHMKAEMGRLGKELAERVSALHSEGERLRGPNAELESLVEGLGKELAECKEWLRLKEIGYEELAQDSAAESERYRLELHAVHEEYQKERKELERRHGVRMLEMELRIGYAYNIVSLVVPEDRTVVIPRAVERDAGAKVVESIEEKEAVIQAKGAEIERLEALVEDLSSQLSFKELLLSTAYVDEEDIRGDGRTTEEGRIGRVQLEGQVKLKLQACRYEAAIEEQRALVAEKEREMQVLVEEVGALRRTSDEQRASHLALEDEWIDKVREKEKGFDRVLGQLAAMDSAVRTEQERAAVEARKVALVQREMDRRDRNWRQKAAGYESDNKELQSRVESSRMQAAEEWECWRVHVERLLADHDRERSAWVEEEARLHTEIEAWTTKCEGAEASRKELENKLRKVYAEVDGMGTAIEEQRRALERRITRVQRDGDSKLEHAEERHQQLLAEYKGLKGRYDKEAATAQRAHVLALEVDELKRTAEPLNAEIERLNGVIATMREQLCIKECIVDDIKRTTADVLLVKEKAYRELLEQFDTLSKDFDKHEKDAAEEKATVVASWEAREEEWKRQGDSYNEMICELRERHKMAMELSEEQQRRSEGLIDSLQLALERTSMRRSDAEQGMVIVLAGVCEEGERMAEDMRAMQWGIEEERGLMEGRLQELEARHKGEMQKLKMLLVTREAEASSVAEALQAEVGRLKGVVENDSEASVLREEVAALQERLTCSEVAIAAAAAESREAMQELELQREEMKGKKAKARDVELRKLLLENAKLKEKLIRAEREKTADACRGVSEEQQQQLEAGPAVYEAEICSLREELSALATAFDNGTASSHALKEELMIERQRHAETREELERTLRNAAAVATAIKTVQLDLDRVNDDESHDTK